MTGTAFPTRVRGSPAPRRTVGAGCGTPRVTALAAPVNAAFGAPYHRWMSPCSQSRDGEAVHPLRRFLARLDPLHRPGRARTVQRGHRAADVVLRALEHHLDP